MATRKSSTESQMDASPSKQQKMDSDTGAQDTTGNNRNLFIRLIQASTLNTISKSPSLGKNFTADEGSHTDDEVELLEYGKFAEDSNVTIGLGPPP